MEKQLGRHEERRTVSRVYLHWGDVANVFVETWEQLWSKNGFNIPKSENSPPAPKVSLPVQPRKIPFINISNTLKNMAFNSLIPKLWSCTDIENLFASWKSREMPAWWWKRQESCQFTGFKIVPLEQWSTAFQGIWIKQELWTKITLCLLALAVGVAALGFHFLSSHSVGGLVLQSGIAPLAQFLRMFPVCLQICALTMAQSSAKGGCPHGGLCSLHWLYAAVGTLRGGCNSVK